MIKDIGTVTVDKNGVNIMHFNVQNIDCSDDQEMLDKAHKEMIDWAIDQLLDARKNPPKILPIGLQI